MVSQRQPIIPTLRYRSSRPASYSRISAAGTLAVTLLLLFCIVPSGAEDPACHYPQIISIDTPQTATQDQYVIIGATVTDCFDCSYHWAITPNGCSPRTEIQTTPAFTYRFYYPTNYGIDLVIADNSQPQCDPAVYSGRYHHEVNYGYDPAYGVGMACCEPNPEIYQPVESSEVGSTLPYWRASLEPPCSNCQYTWSVYKITPDTFVQVPVTDNQGMVFRHTFSEPGDYKIHVDVDNPSICQVNEIGSRRGVFTVTHHVTSPVSTTVQTTIPVVRADVTDQIITVTPGTSTGVPTPVTTTAPVITTTTSRQVTPVGTTGVTRTATTFSPANPAATSTLANAGTGSSAAGVPPAATATTGGSGTGPAATNGAGGTTTTLLLGVIAVLALVICAGVLYLVFRKK